MVGTIRRRLLVNALVDPDEAAGHLPTGLRPHVTEGGTVIGCCLLDIDAIRPASLPAGVGSRLRAAAHRISVEWEDGAGATSVGVYVPVRHTDSRAATKLSAMLAMLAPGSLRSCSSVFISENGMWARWK